MSTRRGKYTCTMYVSKAAPRYDTKASRKAPKALRLKLLLAPLRQRGAQKRGRRLRLPVKLLETPRRMSQMFTRR